MRVVYLSAAGELGGAETCLLELMASIRQSYPAWGLFLIGAQPGPLLSKAASLGVTANVVDFPASIAELGDSGVGGPAGKQMSLMTFGRRLLRALISVPMYLIRLRREVARVRPDVIHSNGAKMHLLGIWSRPQGTPVVWHIHDFIRTRPIMRRLLRFLSSRCAIAVANSESVARDLSYACPELPVSRIYNAIDLTRYNPAGAVADLDKLSGMQPAPKGTVRVGLVATFARWKGHEVFLRAISLLPKECGIRSYIVGGPVYQSHGSQFSLPELQNLAAVLGITDRVGFAGFVQEPSAALRSLDVVVHASTEPEPFGLVIAEAMACGRAVVVTNAGGATELFSDGHDALGVAPQRPQELASAIQRLAQDDALRQRLGAAARRTAEQRFDRKRLAEELAPIYQSLQWAH